MHKVYDIHRPDPQSSFSYVVRVASRTIHRDKTESEVATMRYIMEHTEVPVPFVRSWNSSSNSPANEYIIMKKMPGRPASEVWDMITMFAKINLVTQLARHVLNIFQLRFTLAGSLYMSAPGKYHVGPLVDPVFYEVVAGKELFSNNSVNRHVWEHLQELRGPYTITTTWLAHRISAEVALYKLMHPLPTSGAWTPRHPAYCIEVMTEAADLCWRYPGENPVFKEVKNPNQSFSFMLENDLSNIMIDETGNITSFVDFADAQIVPLWMCAQLPPFLRSEADLDCLAHGGGCLGSNTCRKTLRNVFLQEIARDSLGKEWMDAHTNGRPFRDYYYRMCGGEEFNAERNERWLRKLEAWAMKNPGVGCP